MKKSLILMVALALVGCDDDDGGKGDAGDGGRDTSADVAGDLVAGGDGARDTQDAGGDQPDGPAGPEAGTDASGDAVDARPDAPVRGVANTWWTLTGGTITAIQPVAGVLGNQIVVAGGRGDASDPTSTLASTRYFTAPGDTGTITVMNGMDMQVPRWGAAFAVAGGKLFAIGGADSFSCLTSIEALAAPNGAWAPVAAELPEGRCGATAVALGNVIVLAGGSSVPVPDNMPSASSRNTCLLDTTNLAAGWACSFASGDDIAPTVRFNGAGASTGSLGLIVGGLTPVPMPAVLGAVDQLTVAGANPNFAVGVALPSTRNGPGVAAVGSFFYAMGGATAGGDAPAGTASLFQSGTAAPLSWTARADAPSARVGHVALSARCPTCSGDKLYVVGGHSRGVLVADVDEYTE